MTPVWQTAAGGGAPDLHCEVQQPQRQDDDLRDQQPVTRNEERRLGGQPVPAPWGSGGGAQDTRANTTREREWERSFFVY